MEAVPWGTCQDKVINLAIAGDPVSFSYVGSRTLKGLAENGHIVAVNIPDSQKKMYQPGILETVSYKGEIWGYPHAFSTKALFMNCGILEQAGLACNGPQSWDELYAMAETIKNNTGIAGIGLTGKDFDNTIRNLTLSQQDIEIKKFYLDNFIHRGFPNRREEDWKFSDLNQIIKKNIGEISFYNDYTTTNKVDTSVFVDGLEHNKIVFINGRIETVSYTHLRAHET